MNLRLLGKNTAIYAFGNVTLRATSFLLVPLYTHSLSVEDFGRLETILVTIQILLILMDLGMPSSLIRFYEESKAKDETRILLNATFTILLVANLMVVGVTLVFLSSSLEGMIQSSPGPSISGFLCLSAGAEALTLYFMSIYRAQNRALEYSLYSVISALLMILSAFLLLSVWHFGLRGAIGARILAYGLMATVLGARVIRRLSFRIPMQMVRQVLSFGIPLIISSSAWFILDASDRYFLASYCGMNELAIYALGYKLTFLLLVLIIMPFQLAYGPFIFANLNDPSIKQQMSRILTYLVLILIWLGSLLALFSREIIALISTSAYEGAHLVTITILPAAFLSGIMYWASAQLHIVRKTHYIAITIAVAAIINLILNYVLIPRYGWVGAAIATDGSYMVSAVFMLVLGQVHFPVQFEKRRLTICLILLTLLVFGQVISVNLSMGRFLIVNTLLLLLSPGVLYILGFFSRREIQVVRDTFSRK